MEINIPAFATVPANSMLIVLYSSFLPEQDRRVRLVTMIYPEAYTAEDRQIADSKPERRDARRLVLQARASTLYP